ncbi:hypothetical protein cyc_03676 [Cyclospora cayetanensis]|uniref:Uncharacterized protein n=1 Tax=Cyclospora cayetanensis TaxID=88456 RepID=A0A1D3CUY4_9EIME|nr:hypothetical protein cyc_03676 [Cyclospora cayetanensis]
MPEGEEASSKPRPLGWGGGGGTGSGACSGAVSVGSLPIHKHRDRILEHINNNFITCIQGETGCGKSTQVPKFLLDQDALAQKTLQALKAGKKQCCPSGAPLPLPPLENYRPLRCIVTQPRRLACISLAQRVARELGEETGGVGYLNEVTHVVLDEVHERDVDADLLSLVLKLQLRSRIGKLKIVVMSATMEGNLFFNYFSDIHLRNVPGEDKPSLLPAADEHAEEKRSREQGRLKDTDAVYPDKIFVGARRFPVHIVYLEDLLRGENEVTGLRAVSSEQLSGEALLIEGKEEDEGSAICTSATNGSAEPLGRMESTSSPGVCTEVDLKNNGPTQAKLEMDILGALLKRRSLSLQKIFNSFTRTALYEKNKEIDDLDPTKKEGRKKGEKIVLVEYSETGLQPDIQKGLERVCVDLVSSLAHGGETVLVFLPGIAEISVLYEALASLERPSAAALQNHPAAEGVSLGNTVSAEEKGGAAHVSLCPTNPAFKLFVLHSTIGREEQTEVFSPPPPHTCHVVLASNIAESSLTLPNCRVVLDFCLRRQMICDPNCLRVFDLPEMQTAPLDKLYITVAHLTKRLNAIAQAANPMSPTGSQRNTATPQRTDRHNTIQECMRTGSLTPSQLLLLTVQPPPMSALAAAQAGLREQGALDSNGEITRLGYLMMQLPIDVRLCKLVFLGIVFGCPLDAVVMASCLSSTDLFAFPALMLLQRHSKASAGLEAALQLQQQLKTRALFDGGQFSEPLMLRVAWAARQASGSESLASLRTQYEGEKDGVFLFPREEHSRREGEGG